MKKLLILSITLFFIFFGLIGWCSQRYSSSYAAVIDENSISGNGQVSPLPATILPTFKTINPTVITINPTFKTIDPTINPTFRTIDPTINPTFRTIDPTIITTIAPTFRTIDPTIITIIPTLRTINPSLSIAPTLRPTLTKIPTTTSQPPSGPGQAPYDPGGSVAGVSPQPTGGEPAVGDIIPTDTPSPGNADSLTPGGAAFLITGLTVSDAKVAPGETVTLTATVVNAGDKTGNYLVELLVDGKVVATRQVAALTPGSRDIVQFDFVQEAPANYKIQIGEETTSIIVSEGTNFKTILIIGIVAVIVIALIAGVVRFATK